MPKLSEFDTTLWGQGAIKSVRWPEKRVFSRILVSPKRSSVCVREHPIYQGKTTFRDHEKCPHPKSCLHPILGHLTLLIAPVGTIPLNEILQFQLFVK